MSTIKSSAENLTLNADGSGNDVIIQSNGSTKAIVTAEGTIGIGTTSPQTIISLDENTDAIIGLNRETSGGNGGDLQVRAGAGRGSGNSGGDLYLCSGTGTSSASVGKIQFGRSSGDDSTMPPDEIWATIDSDGLKFNTDTAAANALDDYEEGTFTPTWDGYTPYGTSGKYVKIGTQVTVYATLTTDAATDESLVQLNNLPFQIAGTQGGGMTSHNVVGLYAYNINTKFTNNSTICKLWVSSGGAEAGIKYVSSSQPTFGGYSTLIWTLVYQST